MVDVYRRTRRFPSEERYGLQAQLRRAAVSAPTNMVESCARRSTKDYLYFVGVALGSASEVRYLLSVARRLGFVAAGDGDVLENRYGELIRDPMERPTSRPRSEVSIGWAACLLVRARPEGGRR